MLYVEIHPPFIRTKVNHEKRLLSVLNAHQKHNIPTLRFEVDYFENIKNIHDIYSDRV